MTVEFDVCRDHEPHLYKTFVFAKVIKLVVIGNETTIGYFDEANEYHEETAETPQNIRFNNIGEYAEKEQLVLTLASKSTIEGTLGQWVRYERR